MGECMGLSVLRCGKGEGRGIGGEEVWESV